MKVGQRVKTNNEWNENFHPDGISGTVVMVVSQGPLVANRNHLVLLDDQEYDADKVWFNPFDLERIDG